jgi:hypothetical protein
MINPNKTAQAAKADDLRMHPSSLTNRAGLSKSAQISHGTLTLTVPSGEYQS